MPTEERSHRAPRDRDARDAPRATVSEALARCIEECLTCAVTCTSCADACLGEEHVEDLASCIRHCLDCADVCDVSWRVLTRQTSSDAVLARSVVEACAQACRACAGECERHAAHHEHCRLCAEACRRCEKACQELLGTLAADPSE